MNIKTTMERVASRASHRPLTVSRDETRFTATALTVSRARARARGVETFAHLATLDADACKAESSCR